MKTPRESLELIQTNSPPPAGQDWATDIANGASTVGISAVDVAIRVSKGNAFPVCDREWTQVGAPAEDYDIDAVAFSGWLLRPHMSTADLPFSHPFGFDWECMVALDPECSSLLALGNRIPDGDDGQSAVAQAGPLGVTIPAGGLLAVETDGFNVPSALKNFDEHVVPGDRIAVFGRWIVDTGHRVDVTSAFQPSPGGQPPLGSPSPIGSGPSGHASVGARAVVRNLGEGIAPAAAPTIGAVRDHRGAGGASEGGVSRPRVGAPAGGGVRDHRGAGGAAEGGVSVSDAPKVRDHRGDAGRSSFRSEVHPPLVMAVGGTRQEADGTAVTRILVTSRPYLVSQLFTTDTGSIYDDTAGNDGTFLRHMDNEIAKLTGFIPESTILEAHPKITSKPFTGRHLVRLTVRPPAAAPSIKPVAGSSELNASFQLTHRTGVAIEVTVGQEEVSVWIAMNSDDYISPPLPARHDDWWSKDRLNNLQPGGGDLLTFEEVITGVRAPLTLDGVITPLVEEYFLSKGVQTDIYDASDVDVLDRSHAVERARPGTVQAGQGIVADDGQPYPVYGFIEVRHSAMGVALSQTATSITPTHVGVLEPGGTL